MSRGHGEKMPRKAEQAIAALLSQATLEKAAEQAGVSLRTLKGWLREPRFRRAYREARQAILERTTSLILQLTGKAILTLHASLDARDEAVRLRAAMAVLQYARELAGEVDTMEDVSELKQQVEELQHAQGSAHSRHSAASGNGRHA
jgi:hypothetical protein